MELQYNWETKNKNNVVEQWYGKQTCLKNKNRLMQECWIDMLKRTAYEKQMFPKER